MRFDGDQRHRPRHIAAALDVPVVTVFGPTHPEWTEFITPRNASRGEGFLRACQKKICPLDHRCMTQVTPAMVFETAVPLLAEGGNVTSSAGV